MIFSIDCRFRFFVDEVDGGVEEDDDVEDDDDEDEEDDGRAILSSSFVMRLMTGTDVSSAIVLCACISSDWSVVIVWRV